MGARTLFNVLCYSAEITAVVCSLNGFFQKTLTHSQRMACWKFSQEGRMGGLWLWKSEQVHGRGVWT